MKDKALKLALEALELNNAEWRAMADSGDRGYWNAEEQDHYIQTEKAIAESKEALAQPEQAPCDMGVMCAGCTPRNLDGSCPAAQPALVQQEPVQTRAVHITWNSDGVRTVNGVPDYTPPAAQRKPLTDDEMKLLWAKHGYKSAMCKPFARAIEAAHGIKENT